MKKWIQAFINFMKYPISKKIVVFEAVFCLLIARIAILFFSFKRITSFFGKYQKKTEKENFQKHLEVVKFISFSIEVMSDFVPWKCTCLVQAITAKMMFKRRNIPCTLHLGVAKEDEDKLSAHAWITIEKIILTGRKGMKDFKGTFSFS